MYVALKLYICHRTGYKTATSNVSSQVSTGTSYMGLLATAVSCAVRGVLYIALQLVLALINHQYDWQGGRGAQENWAIDESLARSRVPRHSCMPLGHLASHQHGGLPQSSERD